MTVAAAGPGRYHLIRQLEAEWQVLAVSAAARRALARWGAREPALAGWQDLEQLRAACRRDGATADRVLAALVRLAATDGQDDALAARVVVQLLLPGAVRLVGALRGILGGGEAAEAAVLGELVVLARTYPWRRRPRRVAANLLLDCRQRLTRAARAGSGRERPDGLVPAPSRAQPVWLDDGPLLALDLLRWAHRRGTLTKREAALLFAAHVAEVPMYRLQRHFRRGRSSLFSDRAAAERSLRSALARGHLR